MNCPEGKEVITTSGTTAVLLGTSRSMGPCDHEEADTRLLIHLQGAIQNSCTKCVVCTVDTVVVMILIGKFHHLLTLCQDVNIWVAFGTGKSFTYYNVNAIYKDLGREKSLALTVFHSFTGCETTSTLFGRGKKSTWGAWNCYKCVTCAFTYMAAHPFTQVGVDNEHFQMLERFTIILYDKASELLHVDEARRALLQEGKDNGTTPSNPGCTIAALEASGISG